MKLLHVSDLHIGLRLMNRELEEDQRFVLRQIASQAEAEQPDAILIAGDIFDKSVPSAEAVTLFDDFILWLAEAAPKAELMLVSGNHDSAARLNLYRGLLSRQKIHAIGLPPVQAEEHIEQVTLYDEYGPVHFYLLPFVKPSMVKAITGTDPAGNNLSYDEAFHRLIEREAPDYSERNVLVSHQFFVPSWQKAEEVERSDSEIRMVGNVDQIKGDVLDKFDYAALGHIHKPTALSNYHRYCGTPMPCSVSEAGQEKASVLVELGPKGQRTLRLLSLAPLHQVRVITGTLREVLPQACDDYVTVILTDKEELDILDMQDRIRSAFPNLLELRRDSEAEVNYSLQLGEAPERDPFTLCCEFLPGLDEKEKDILRDVVNTVLEVK